MAQPDQMTSLPLALQHFYQGKPKALGITQVIIGALQIVLGLSLRMLSVHFVQFYANPVIRYRVTYWCGVLSIASGAFLIMTQKRPKISMVRNGLISNIASAVASWLSIIIYIVSIRFVDHVTLPWTNALKVTTTILLLVLLLLSILEFFLASASSYYGSKAMCRRDFTEGNRPKVQINNTMPHSSLPEPPQAAENRPKVQINTTMPHSSLPEPPQAAESYTSAAQCFLQEPPQAAQVIVPSTNFSENPVIPKVVTSV